MFEEMRHTGKARRIINRPHPEPNHLGGDWSTVIGDHQDLHAIAQRELERVVAGLAGICGGRRGKLRTVRQVGWGGNAGGHGHQRCGDQPGGGDTDEPRTSQTSRRSHLSSEYSPCVPC